MRSPRSTALFSGQQNPNTVESPDTEISEEFEEQRTISQVHTNRCEELFGAFAPI
jgi:hypothetical protein